MLTPKVTETRRGSAHGTPATGGQASGPTRLDELGDRDDHECEREDSGHRHGRCR